MRCKDIKHPGTDTLSFLKSDSPDGTIVWNYKTNSGHVIKTKTCKGGDCGACGGMIGEHPYRTCECGEVDPTNVHDLWVIPKKIVYLVNAGTYEDRVTIAAFSSRELAEKFMERYPMDYNEVEVWVVDEIDPFTEEQDVYKVVISKYGTVIDTSKCIAKTIPTEVQIQGYFMTVTCNADSKEQAIEIASDLRNDNYDKFSTLEDIASRYLEGDTYDMHIMTKFGSELTEVAEDILEAFREKDEK